ncbi:hypothetical protein DL95DRAFT_501232 [Leptodontidium sp. 2 PMI_412]|nr:hypothetical protein DL95DRAFT_501232 [Leptodontidium sp. 2 PMI_412]
MEDSTQRINSLAVAFLILSLSTVGLRCYIRTSIVKSFGVDDWFAVGSQVSFTANCILAVFAANNGTGHDINNLSPNEVETGLMIWFFGRLSYAVTTALLKASACFFLLRIAVNRREIYILYGVLAALLVFTIFYFIFTMFQCQPVPYFWTQVTGAYGSCMSTRSIEAANYTHSAMCIATDWTVSVLPVFMVWNLQMSTRTKASVVLILGLGIFASTATIVRVLYIKNVGASANFLTGATNILLWSIAEEGVGIIASSLATFKPLFTKYFNWNSTIGSQSRRSHFRIMDGQGQEEHVAQSKAMRKCRVDQDLMELQAGGNCNTDGLGFNKIGRDAKQSIDRGGSTDEIIGGTGMWQKSETRLNSDSGDEVTTLSDFEK